MESVFSEQAPSVKVLLVAAESARNVAATVEGLRFFGSYTLRMLRADDVFSDVGTKHVRYVDRTVCTLVVFNDLRDDARKREGGVVE